MTVAAVILAAGSGSRFSGGDHKLRTPFGTSTILGTAVATAVSVGLDETVVVAGAVDVSDLVPSSVTLVRNDRWMEGMATSLHVACDLAGAHGHDAIVVGLGDQPLVPEEAWQAVAATHAPIAVATYDGTRGHPVRLEARVWPLLPVTGEVGARELMRLRPDLVREVPCQGTPADIDTREDLERWS